ncbi:MAG: tetratricopeptide repeat protein [Fimbriimonadales bacterium]|nr:tetratricopeptide repeat protein [Fimbriimonadales bacterium]
MAMGDSFSFIREGLEPDPAEPRVDGLRQPATAEDARRRGDAALRQGEFDEAFRYYKLAIRMDGENSARYMQLGDAYAYADQPARALAYYQRARKMNPRDPEPYFALGEIYRRYGRYDAAIAHFKRAIEFGANNAFVQFKYAEVLALSQQYAKAVEAGRAAVNHEPSNGFYRFWLADLLEQVGEVEEAMQEMEIATLLNPEDDYYHFRYGLLCIENECLTRAIECFQRALSLKPRSALYLTLLGDVYTLLNESHKADKAYQQAGGLDSYDRAELQRARRLAGLDNGKLHPHTQDSPQGTE